MPKKTKPKNAKPSSQKKTSKPAPKKSISHSKDRRSDEDFRNFVHKLSPDKRDRLHGRKGMPDPGKKYLPPGEEDYGQATFDPSKKHLTVADLMKLLSKIRNPDKKRVWFDGSLYWGRCSGLRLFDMTADCPEGREVLLEKGN